jgi:hypothetical protein
MRWTISLSLTLHGSQNGDVSTLNSFSSHQEQRTHNGNLTIVNIGVPWAFNELTVHGFPPFPVIPGLATQKQRKKVAAANSASAT